MKKTIPFLFLALFLFVPQVKADVFTDVPDTHYNQEAITYLKAQGIVEGYSNNSYKPENRINRAEFTKIIIRSVYSDATIDKCTSSPFPDVPSGQWFAKYVCMAKKYGVVGGYPDGTFHPSDFINFAEASKVIANAQGVKSDTAGTQKEWFAGFVKGLEDQKAIPSTIQSFDKEITRGDMSEMIFRLKDKRTDKVTATYQEMSEAFPKITSCPALLDKFDEYRSRPNIYYPMAIDAVTTKDSQASTPPMAGGVAPSSTPEAANDFSQTNVQVAGVDEADIIKNDGEYIYMVKGDTVRIVKAFPPKTMSEVATINFGDNSFYPNEIYVNKDRLIVIGQSANYYGIMPMAKMASLMMRPYYNSSQTKIFVYDLTDHTKPKELRHVTLDGNYQTSRRIDDQLTLVLNASPNMWAWDSIKSGSQTIPFVTDGDGQPQAMVGCADIRYFPGYTVPQYLITASFDVRQSDSKISRNVFLGSGDNVYSSTTNLYVANTAFNYGLYTDWDWSRDQTKTNIFRFSLANGGVEYKAKGTVTGSILNQFSMDEYNDYFRIATNSGNTWNENDPAKNNVYVLNADMKTVGHLDSLARNERIYSTRFVGDRLYMVTFKQVDPLFVIDLSVPTKPTVLGELQIPGFSQYLHPYDANHIIGFGQSTEQNEFGGIVTNGFKMALFDVTDVSNPKQQFVKHIGDTGTSSELLYNHKALLFDKSKDLLAFPITIQEKIDPKALQCGKYNYDTCPALCQTRCIPTECHKDANGLAVCTNDCTGLGSCTEQGYQGYTTTFSGALVFSLNLKDGFTERGRISHYTAADMSNVLDYFPFDYNKTIQRILYMGDYLYTVAQGGVKASGINDAKEVNFVKLGE